MSIQYAGGTNRNDLYAARTTSNQCLTAINTTLVAAGWTSSAVKASSTLTVTANPSNNETVTLAGKVYTFKAAINNANDGEVAVGVDAATSISNLKAAVNLGAGSGTAYSTATTLNASIEGGTLTSTTVVFQEKTGGLTTPFNVSETLANGSFSDATTVGGGYKWTSALTPQYLNLMLYAASMNEGNTFLRLVVSNSSQTETSAAIASGQRIFGAASQDIRIIANKYQCWLMIDGTGDSTNDFFGCGVPWIPNFLTGVAISGATNASPIVVTTSSAHGLSTGNSVTIRGVLGNLAANVTNNTVTVLTTTTFSIDASTGNGAWTSGGAVGKVGSAIVECIWMQGTANSGKMFRIVLTADSNTYWTALNGSTNAHSGAGGTGTLKLAFTNSVGYTTDELTWFNATEMGCEPFLVFGTGTGTTGTVNGQLWDMAVIRKAMTRDITGTADSHNWWNLTSNNTTQNASVIHVVP